MAFQWSPFPTKFATAIVIRYRDSNLDAVFPGNSGSKSVRIVTYYGGSKTLAFSMP